MAPPPVKARVLIRDQDTSYSCESPERDKVHAFIQWFLYDVAGTAIIDIRYDQREIRADVVVPPVTHEGEKSHE